MSAYNVVNRTAMVAGQPEDISVVLANFDAIAGVINGAIDQTNISSGATPTMASLTLTNNNKTALVLSGAGAGLTIGGDTNLYRAGAGQLASDGSGIIFLASGGNGYTLFASRRAADTQMRFRIQDAGPGGQAGAMIQWGDGTNPPDVNLYRFTAGVLALGTTTQFGRLRAYGNSTTVFEAYRTTDTQPRWAVNDAGAMSWGTGAAGVDLTISRLAQGAIGMDALTGTANTSITFTSRNAGVGVPGGITHTSAGVMLFDTAATSGVIYGFRITGVSTPLDISSDGRVRTLRATDGNDVYQAFRAGEAQPFVALSSGGAVGGRIQFGPGVSTALDSTLARVGVNQLAVGSGTPQSNALLSVVGSGSIGNALEWGAGGNAAFRSTLGSDQASGQNFLAFNGEHGTNASTYRTRGTKASIIEPDNAGGIRFGTVASNNADNQGIAYTVVFDSSGVITWSTDTNIYRQAADKLQTDDGFSVGKALVSRTVTTASLGTNGTFNVDASLGNTFIFTMTAALTATIAAPTNPSTGQVITIILRTNGTGTVTVNWNAVYHAPAFQMPTADLRWASNTFVYDGTNWLMTASAASMA